MKAIVNDHHKTKLIEAAQLKHKEAMEKFHPMPVIICSKGCVEFTPVELFKRESSITSASGTEEITPVQSHRCNVCQKLLPYASQIGGIPDILISSCKMHTTDDPELISILSNWISEDESGLDGPFHRSWEDHQGAPASGFQLIKEKLHRFFTFKK